MKVVYNTIVDDIDEAIEDAGIANRKINYIELTIDEWLDYIKCKGLQLDCSAYDTKTKLPLDGRFLYMHRGRHLYLRK